jgi:hypothetical protein
MVMKKKKNLRQVGITIPFTDHIQVTNVCSSCLLTGYADLIHTHRFSKHLHILPLEVGQQVSQHPYCQPTQVSF